MDTYTTPDEVSQEDEPLLTVREAIGFKTPEPVLEVESENIPSHTKGSWEAYNADPSQENLAAAVQSLSPVIHNVLATYQSLDDPMIKSKARVIAAKAIQTYDPSKGVGLPTWVSSQLRQISRVRRTSQNILSVPEGIQLDGYALYRAEEELREKKDREPTTEELADRTGFSVKRISDIRKKSRPVAMEGSYETENANFLKGGETDNYKEATEYVYNSGDVTDKRLLELATGYGGAIQKSSAAIMTELGLTPVQLSRRKARIALEISKIVRDLDSI